MIQPSIGTRDEIQDALLRATEMEKPKAYHQRIFRRPLDGATGERVGWRSPLTNEQTAELRPERNVVCIICGHPAAGLRQLPDFLRLESDQNSFAQADDAVADFGSFHHWPDDRLQSQPGGTLFVPDQILWSAKWVKWAAERCGRQ